MGWPLVRIGDLVRVRHGGTPSKARPEFWAGDIPWVSPKDFYKGHLRPVQDFITKEAVVGSATSVVPEGTVLAVARSGVLAHSFPIAITERAVSFNQDVKAFIGDYARIAPRYLYHVLRSIEPIVVHQGVKRGATVHSLQSGFVEAMEVPLPPLAEQRRIVDILDRAAAIQRLRRAAEEKAREIIPALFVDMFGDPATNPKGWPMNTLEEVAKVDRGRSRHRPRDYNALYGGPYPFIQTSEVANSGGIISHHTNSYSELGLAQSRLWPAGTLCVTIAANIAKTRILQFAACFPDSVVAVIPGDDTNNEYLQAWLSFLQPTLEAQAPQLAQKNINLEILRGLAVPMPPKALQDRFSDMCERIRAIRELARNRIATIEDTNRSLSATLMASN